MPQELRSDRRDDIFKEYVIARIEKSGEKFEVLVKPDGWGNVYMDAIRCIGCRRVIVRY